MARRNISLTPRIEDVRELETIPAPVQFELTEIKEHFDESLECIKKQFSIADGLMNSEKEDEAKTIYRSQIVFLEGILDFYLHEITKFCLYKIFLGDWDKTDKYKNLKIPMAEVEKALEAPESKVWFFDYVNDIYAKVVMQDWETIKDQLNLCGISWNDIWRDIYPNMDEQHAIRAGKSILTALYSRRNVIAHQNDRSHASAIQNDIEKEYVEEQIQEVERFVNTIHMFAINKDSN